MLRLFKADGRRGFVLLALLLACGLIQAAAPQSIGALRYERGALAAGELWRLLSAHFTHLNAQHLLVNLAGLVLVWSLVIDELPPLRWLLAVLAIVLGIDAGLWWLSSEVSWYVGASGALHGVLVAGFVCGLWRRDPVAMIGLPIVIGKLLLEQRGGSMGITDSLPVVSVAHLYGAVAGAAAGAVLHIRRTPPAPAAGPARTPAARR
jgi:rhomboid family GlyGly-CTERM serine protease